MKNKIIIIGLCSLFLCGCESKEEKLKQELQTNKEAIVSHIKNNISSSWEYADDKVKIDDDLNVDIIANNTEHWSFCAIFGRDQIQVLNNDSFKDLKINKLSFTCYNNDKITSKIELDDPKNTNNDNFESKAKFYDANNSLVSMSIKEGYNSYFYEYKQKCNTYTYKEIFRNSDKYKGKFAKFTGEVIQVQVSGDYYSIRLNVTKDQYGYYDDTMMVYIPTRYFDGRILEDDIIEVYGELTGLETYTAVLGQEVTIPQMLAEYVFLVE